MRKKERQKKNWSKEERRLVCEKSLLFYFKCCRCYIYVMLSESFVTAVFHSCILKNIIIIERDREKEWRRKEETNNTHGRMEEQGQTKKIKKGRNKSIGNSCWIRCAPKKQKAGLL